MLGIQLRSFDDELHTLGPDILVIDSATLGRISGRLFGEVALADAHDGYIVFHRSSVRAHGHFRDDVSASAKVTFSLTPEFYKNFASVASRNSYTKPPDINGGSAPEKLSEPCK